jgi:glycosyltransferase involved in cell wall biosynthesis
MTLIVIIPCFNEANTLPSVVESIPSIVAGADVVKILVVDDGSRDGTSEVACQLSVDYIVRHPYNRGFAAALQTGFQAALTLEADIVVLTDGDNQYPQADIPRLIAPILHDQADVVIGNRQPGQMAEYSFIKRILQVVGSWVVRQASNTQVADAASGFRAFSREAVLRLNILTRFTPSVEIVVQAGKKGLRIASIPIRTNPPTRKSRLMKSTWQYVKRQAATIIRLYALYEPLRTFGLISLPFLSTGLVLLIRFGILFLMGEGGVGRHVQSLVIGGTALVLGLLIFLFGMLADLVAANRQLAEEALYRIKKMTVRLAISQRTVELHRRRIMQKLQAESAVDLARQVFWAQGT